VGIPLQYRTPLINRTRRASLVARPHYPIYSNNLGTSSPFLFFLLALSPTLMAGNRLLAPLAPETAGAFRVGHRGIGSASLIGRVRTQLEDRMGSRYDVGGGRSWTKGSEANLPPHRYDVWGESIHSRVDQYREDTATPYMWRDHRQAYHYVPVQNSDFHGVWVLAKH
jgi:hypothetical protein